VSETCSVGLLGTVYGQKPLTSAHERIHSLDCQPSCHDGGWAHATDCDRNLDCTADAALHALRSGLYLLAPLCHAEACPACCCGLQATPRVLTAQQPAMKHLRQQNSSPQPTTALWQCQGLQTWWVLCSSGQPIRRMIIHPWWGRGRLAWQTGSTRQDPPPGPSIRSITQLCWFTVRKPACSPLNSLTATCACMRTWFSGNVILSCSAEGL
jgi:hypothetical protein